MLQGTQREYSYMCPGSALSQLIRVTGYLDCLSEMMSCPSAARPQAASRCKAEPEPSRLCVDGGPAGSDEGQASPRPGSPPGRYSKRPRSGADPEAEQLTIEAGPSAPRSSTRGSLATISDEDLEEDIRCFWRTGPCADKLVRATDSPAARSSAATQCHTMIANNLTALPALLRRRKNWPGLQQSCIVAPCWTWQHCIEL